jgi:hypothetical protein
MQRLRQNLNELECNQHVRSSASGYRLAFVGLFR